MHRTCRVPGCSKPARSPQGAMCEGHRQRWRRHGDPKQQAISKRDIAPFVNQVKATIEKDTTSRIEAGLNKLKNLLEDDAKATIAESKKRAMSKHRLRAAHEMLKVLQGVDAITLASVIAGTCLLQEYSPRRFASDRGFNFQLVRRFRALSDLNAGTYYNHETGKVHRVYKDVPAQVTELLGQTIIHAYQTFIALIIKRERAKAKESELAADLMKKGFESLDK